MHFRGEIGYVDGTAKAEIRSINEFDGRLNVKEIESGALWYGLEEKRFKAEPTAESKSLN